jgi:hypothetical protein
LLYFVHTVTESCQCLCAFFVRRFVVETVGILSGLANGY